MSAAAVGAVVVTGAGGGIGLACARALADREAPMLLQDLDERRLAAAQRELASEGIPAQTVAGDLCDPAHVAAVARVVAQMGGLHALAHAAGISPTMGDARRVFEVDLVATVRLVDALTPEL